MESPNLDYDEQLEFELGDNDKIWASLLYSVLKKTWLTWWIDAEDGTEYELPVPDLESRENLSFSRVNLSSEDIKKYTELKNQYLKEITNERL